MNTNRHLLNDDQANNQSARNRTPKVFIIHGSAKYVAQVEDLCRNWGLVPVTAIDEPNQGKIVVDKILENMENADYRVAILTVDEHTDSGEPSASPNAYMETFVARYMSRDSLAILLEDNVRIPSNLEGMAYIRLDDQWTMKLLEELKAAGLIQVTATRTN